MKEIESIPVWIKVINGKTVCICLRGCDHHGKCERDIVKRDRFRGWKSTMNRNRYGK